MSILRDLFGPGTWGVSGNLVASAILGAIGAAAAWLGRHKVIPWLAGVWDKHHGPKAVERHKQALREHDAEKRQREEGSA